VTSPETFGYTLIYPKLQLTSMINYSLVLIIDLLKSRDLR